MINWREGTAGFVGASKRLIKGVFSYVYSIPVTDPPPTFAGTIPDITIALGYFDTVTDISTYFTYPTSYSIAPAVETGWTFDTITGILTVNPNTAGQFIGYVVTGTNASGSVDSSNFNVTITNTPTKRTFTTARENRTMETESESREFHIERENRSFET